VDNVTVIPLEEYAVRGRAGDFAHLVCLSHPVPRTPPQRSAEANIT